MSNVENPDTHFSTNSGVKVPAFRGMPVSDDKFWLVINLFKFERELKNVMQLNDKKNLTVFLFIF